MRLTIISRFLLVGLVGLCLQNCANSPQVTEQNQTDGSENLAISENVDDQQTVIKTLTKRSVTPPLESIDVPKEKITLSKPAAKVITLESGSSIEIPEGAFVDAAGNPVNTPVDIEFREFHDPASIIASGIPMSLTTEEGTVEWMQTAGMFEIQGYSEGEAVFIAPGKSIQVNLVSEVPGDYDFWYLDQQAGNWDNKGAVPANSVESVSEGVSNSKEIAELRAKAAQPPVPPVAFDKTKPALNFNVNFRQFPELKDKKGIIWQYAGNMEADDPMENQWIFKEDWTNVSLEKSNKPGQYQMSLESDTKEYSIPVLASQKGKDLARAQAEYQKRLAEFNALKQALANKEELLKKQRAFIRSFEIQGFGIYNYDILYKQKERIPLVADFEFDGMSPATKRLARVYLITGNQKAIVEYNSSSWRQFSVDPTADNRMVAILPGNKIAVFTQRDFDQQMEFIKKAAGENFTFQMEVKDQPVKDMDDLKSALGPLG